MDEIVIRKATHEDMDAVGALWEELVAYHTQIDGDLPAATEGGGKLYADRLLGRVDDTHTRVMVAEVSGEVVGYVLGVIVDLVPEMFEQTAGGFLADIYVRESHRQRGIGRKLVEGLTDWFREHRVAYFEWNVAAKNGSGRAFWESVGGRDMMIRMRHNLT